MLKKVLFALATAATLTFAASTGASAHYTGYPHSHDRWRQNHRVHCWTEQRRVTIWRHGHRIKVWQPVRICR